MARDTYTNVQVRMETAIVEEVKLFMKLDEVSWNDLLTACFMAYLDESRIIHADEYQKMTDEIQTNRSSVPSSVQAGSQIE